MPRPLLLHGLRQSGNTTIARVVGGPRGCRNVQLDDDAALTAARPDSSGFVAGPPAKSILDETICSSSVAYGSLLPAGLGKPDPVRNIQPDLALELDRRRGRAQGVLVSLARVALYDTGPSFVYPIEAQRCTVDTVGSQQNRV